MVESWAGAGSSLVPGSSHGELACAGWQEHVLEAGERLVQVAGLAGCRGHGHFLLFPSLLSYLPTSYMQSILIGRVYAVVEYPL